jgi:pimeloyl-ACP methyl ester carboxylesterase
MLIVMGSEDTVIPSAIPEILLHDSTRSTQKELHIVDGAPHMLAGWTQDNPENAKYIGKLLEEFLS